MIELHDVLYVLDIAYTLYSVVEHGRQPDWLFVIENGATTLGFPIFTLLGKTNKDITLYSDLSFKDRHSQSEYTNLPNDFKNTTVRLIHDKAAIPSRSTKDYAAYDLHSIEQVSIKHDETKKLTPTWTSNSLKAPLVL